MQIKIKKLVAEALIPKYATPGAAGFDLHSIEDYEISPQQTVLVKTGLSFEIPIGFELQVRPRSGLSLKTPLRVSNSPGTVDSDYRGEVCVIMTNTATEGAPILIKKEERVAQGVVCPIIVADFQVSDFLTETERNSGGFGSTGNS